jgi:hypothetical protein
MSEYYTTGFVDTGGVASFSKKFEMALMGY